MATQSQEEPCLLCGEAATLRCEACFQATGLTIPFCSKEHQVLVRVRLGIAQDLLDELR